MVTYNGNGTQSSPKRLVAVGTILIVSLLIAGLFLPPISLAQRLGMGGDATGAVGLDTPLTADGLTLTVGEGAAVDVRAVATADAAGDEGAAAMMAALPPGVTLQGDLYLLEPRGAAATGSVALAVPATARVEQLDLYGWNGSAWYFMPVAAAGDTFLRGTPAVVPQGVALVSVAPPDMTAVGAEILPTQELPPALLPHLTEVSVGTLTLQADGSLAGELVEMPAGGYRQFVRATNTGIFVDQASLSAVLGDETRRAQHQSELLAVVEAYDGLNLDYQGVTDAQRAQFTALVNTLSDALRSQGKTLVLTLDAPLAAGDDRVITAGYDWPALASVADAVYMRMPLDPDAYGAGNLDEELVDWAVRQVPRQKLTLLFSANAIDVIGGSFQEMPNMLALAHFGELSVVGDATTVPAGTAVEVGLTGEASPLEWDGASSMYKYSYEQAGQLHTVWLNNEAAVSQRLRLALPYNLRGIALRGLGGVASGERYAVALESYLAGEAVTEPAGAALLWTVEADGDGVIASESGEALTYRWDGTTEAGTYTINAIFTQGDTQATLGSVAVTVEEEVVAEVEVTPEPTETPEDERAAAAPETDTTGPQPTPTATLAPVEPGSADAVVNTPANFRTGPSVAFGTQRVLALGTKVSLIGRTGGSDWLQVRPADSPDEEGWVYASLLTVNSGVSVSSLAVVEVAPPVSSGGNDGGGAPPPPIAGGTSFELGGQAFGAPYGQMSYAGMTWIKRQHKWSLGNTGQEVAGIITEAHNAGLKILLSIPGADHSSIDYNAYVTFLRNVASLPDPPDAIEVWNEQNIDREWPAGQIQPQIYVNQMLAPAYQAIKGANSRIMVISGAPSPTGFFGGGCGAGGCDDNAYVAGMAAAGAASYMDCIGIHYNEGILPPSQESGDPRGSSGHYTRYFWGMVNTYYNAFGGSRPLCFTELGYLSPEGYGTLPGGFSWAQNVTVGQQAQWLASAASLSASSGKVRMLIVWNIDSTTWNSDPQAGYAIIRPGGSCPACETLHQVMGR